MAHPFVKITQQQRKQKDATSASKKNYLSPADLNYHPSINVMNSCPHAATETKRYCVAIEQSI